MPYTGYISRYTPTDKRVSTHHEIVAEIFTGMVFIANSKVLRAADISVSGNKFLKEAREQRNPPDWRALSHPGLIPPGSDGTLLHPTRLSNAVIPPKKPPDAVSAKREQ